MDPLSLTKSQVKTLQRTLNQLHGAKLVEDGIFGDATLKALNRFGDAAEIGVQVHSDDTELKPSDRTPVDARSEGVIAKLLPAVQPLMRAVVNRFNAASQNGHTLVATSGLRTYAEQDLLYKQRPKVTNAPGGYSNHNFGCAVDFTVFDGKTPIWESPEYHNKVGVIGKALGLTWGGDWSSIQDEPHLELRPAWAAQMSESAMLAEFRRRKSDGQDLLV